MAARICAIGAIAFSLLRSVGKTFEFQDLDFGAVYRGASAVAVGETPYVVDEYGPLGSYIYGPALAFLTQPLAALDYLWACRVWTVFNWILALAILLMALQLAMRSELSRAQMQVALWLTALPVASYIWSGIRVGQVAVLTATLLVMWAFLRLRGRPFVAGMCLAASATLKLAPAFLIPYLLVRREWRGLAGVAVGAVLLALVPAAWVGFDGAIQLHLDWAAHCRNTQVVEQTFRPENQSLIGQLARLPGISNGHELTNATALAQLGRAYGWMILAIGAVIYGYLWRSNRKSVDTDRPEPDVMQLGILLVVMTLLSPRAWTCNFISLVVIYAFLAVSVVRRNPGWRAALVALCLGIVVCALPKAGPRPEWSVWIWIAQGKDFWAAVVASIVCIRIYSLRNVHQVRVPSKPAIAA